MRLGGWQGSMSTAGGLTRTYGLQDHFSKPGQEGPLPPINKATMRRVMGYFRPYWRSWLVVLACIGVAAGLGVVPPLCVRWILDKAIPHADLWLLTWLCIAMVALAVASGFVGVLQQTVTARVGQGMMHDLRNELFQHVQKLSLRFYITTRSGEIVSRINNDVGAVQGVATGTVVTIANNIATLAATSVALFWMNWKLTLVAIAVMPAFYVPSRIVGGIRRRLSTQTQESQASLLAFLNERLHVGGIVLAGIFGQKPADASEFSRRSQILRDLTIRQTVVGRWLFMILSVFSAVGPALIYWYGGYEAIHEKLTPGMLVAFAALLTLLYRPMVQLATVYVDVQAGLAVFDRIFEYLDLIPDVIDRKDARAVPTTQGHIVLEHVHFTYPIPPAAREAAAETASTEPPLEPFALRDISFEIRPGQRVALVGPSGSGKTTLTYIVPRFYDPAEGRVLLDGIDLRELQQASLRNHIAMVTQETFLFHASIRENLLYARPGAGEVELIEACKAANIHEFVAALPQGYDTVVGERGFRLSGGEKQRISIARALLKDPAILILDEATSSLDSTSEALIQEALERLLRGRTSLIIAHRLSTILNSDLIIVLDAGRIVDKGRHADLLAHDGLYATLFNQQFARALERR